MGNGPSLAEGPSFHGRYALGKQLGRGSQGRVHACADRDTGAQYAVKIIDRSARTAWATYRREVELCQAASARNVVTVCEAFFDCSFCYVVMERFEGHLRKGLRFVAHGGRGKGPALEDAALRRIVRQALGAVVHLHRCHIIHRDVKAHNLFTDRLDLNDERCRVVLGDFGLARRLEPGRYLSSQVGTKKYWAPELYTRKYWHSVDVFAIGVVIFLASSSMYPFMDERQTRTRDVSAERGPLRHLDPCAHDFMLQLLEKDPIMRPAADEELFSHPWFANHGEEGISEESLDDLGRRDGNYVRKTSEPLSQSAGDACDGLEVSECEASGAGGAAEDGDAEPDALGDVEADDGDGWVWHSASEPPPASIAAVVGTALRSQGKTRSSTWPHTQVDYTEIFTGADHLFGVGGRAELLPVVVKAL